MQREPTSLGKYRLLQELGRGGMGIVYEAEDTQLSRRVALKLMLGAAHADPREAPREEERFLREAQLAARLPKHPHLVGVYEAGVVDGRRYIAMELVQGIPLSEWREARLATPREEVELLRDAALAVDHAHAHGIIHRDLKPANILVDGQNHPHITDFGLAKLVGQNTNVSLTGANMTVGTPAYMSPEQAKGDKATDRRADVYALGVMLYETLTGRPPFQGETALEILMKAAKNAVPLPSAHLKVRLTPSQTRGLETVCLKALEKSPADRYPDAAAFAADLTRWLKGDEVRAHRRTRRMGRLRARRRRPAAVAAGVVLAALALWGVAGSRPGPAQEKSDPERRAAEGRLKPLEAHLMPAAAAAPADLAPGLVGEYFSGTNFEILSLRRIDPEIAYQGKPPPAWPDGPAELISIRWQGWLRIPESGPYVFQARGPDGVRLFLDGAEIFSQWMPRVTTSDTGFRLLEKGLHRIVVEHVQRTGRAGLAVTWNRGSASGPPEPAAGALFHEPARFTPLARKPAVADTDVESLPGAQEAETLSVQPSVPDATFVLPFGRRKGLLVWGRATKPGDRLKVRFTSDRTRATLILALGRARNGGTVRITLNGAVLAASLDLYYPSNHVLESEFKNVDLKTGPNELEFTLLGSNPLAVEWRKGDGVHKLSLDYLRLR